METTSKEVYKKIKNLKKELSQTRSHYHSLIRPLKQRESLVRQLKPVAIVPKISEIHEQKMQNVKERIKELEKERDEKIEKLEKELAAAKDDYRKNYEKYKEKDKKSKQDGIENKRQDIKIFFDRNKIKIIAAGILVSVVLVIAVPTIISNNIKRSIEEGRDYYINMDENYTFDCNAKYSAGNFAAYCEDRFISGTFSNYDTVEFPWAFDLTVDGNTFTHKLSDMIDPPYYQKDTFNIEELKNGIDKTHYISLENKILNRRVAHKNVKVHYNFTEADLNLISQLHDKWVIEEAEKAIKAQQEAEEKAKKEAEEKAQKEAQARQEAEEKAKKEAEEKAAREKAAQEEAERKAAEEEAKKSYKIKKINDGETCPSNAKYCYISGNSSGNTTYGYGFFRGKIINNTGRDLSYIQVTADVYNSADSKVGDCWGNTSGLAAGTTWEFEAYCTAWSNSPSLKNIDIDAY